MFPAGTEQGDALSSYFGPSIVLKCPFGGLFSATINFFFFLHFCAFLLVILLLKVAQHSTEVLSIVPKCLTERIGNLQPGMSYSAVDHEFSH